MRKLIAFITLFGVFMFAFVGFSIIKAFIIYEANYDDDSILQLPVAKKDALNLKEALSKIPDSQITLLENPTAGEFIREFKKWINSTTPQDTLIVYYAGHGISKDGKFYFIPADADPEESLTWISFSNLEKYIKEDRKIVWLIDACYSGAMVKGRPLRAVRIQKEALHAQGDQVIITSSSGNEISREMPDGSGGLFTVSLVKALQGGADKDKDGWIESGELYEYVKEQVSKLSQDQQHPVMKGKGDIKVVSNIAGKMEKLRMEVLKAFDSGEISEDSYKNIKSLLDGKKCSGPALKDIKEAINKYTAGKLDLDSALTVIKLGADKLVCEGVKKEKVTPVQPPHNANVKVDFLKVDIPGTIMEGSKVPIKIKALIGKVWHDINPNEAEITVVGDSIEVKDGNVIATKPGNATLRVEYGNVAEKKDITVHGKIDVEIGVGYILGSLGIPVKIRVQNIFARFVLIQPLDTNLHGIKIEAGLEKFFKYFYVGVGGYLTIAVLCMEMSLEFSQNLDISLDSHSTITLDYTLILESASTKRTMNLILLIFMNLEIILESLSSDLNFNTVIRTRI